MNTQTSNKNQYNATKKYQYNVNILNKNQLNNKNLGNLKNILLNNSSNITVNQKANIQLLKDETKRFFQKLFTDLKYPGRILSIILAFTMYSSAWYDKLKDHMYERSSNNIEISFLEQSNNILNQPLKYIFLDISKNIDTPIYTLYQELDKMTLDELEKRLYKGKAYKKQMIKKQIDELDDIKTGIIHFIIKEELNLNQDKSLYILLGVKKIKGQILQGLFDNNYLEKHHNIFNSLLEQNYYKFMELNKLKNIIISVYLKWEEYIKKRGLYNKKFLLYSGSKYLPKQSNKSKYYSIKTLESTTYDLQIAKNYTVGNTSNVKLLKLFVVDMYNILNIEMFSKYREECEILLYSPHSLYQIYDTGKTQVREINHLIKGGKSTEEVRMYTFDHIYLIIKNNRTLNNLIKGGKSTKKVRKHQGIYQIGSKKGKLKPGFKYSGKKTKTGLKIIVKVKKNSK